MKQLTASYHHLAVELFTRVSIKTVCSVLKKLSKKKAVRAVLINL